MSNLADVKEAVRNVVEPRGAPLRPSGAAAEPAADGIELQRCGDAAQGRVAKPVHRWAEVIERAGVSDLEGVAACAALFTSSSRFLEKFDARVFERTWTRLLEPDLGVIFVLRVAGEIACRNGGFTESAGTERIAGIIGGVVYPDPNSGELVATEFFWFVRADSRGGGIRLFRAFEGLARGMQCSEIRMAHMLDSMPEKLERVYRRFGFAPVEVHYVKELRTEAGS